VDPRERIGDRQLAVSAALDGRQAQIWTCLPGIIQSFDATKMTASVQPTIQGQVRNQQGVWQNKTLPVCVDCPVQFPGGGGFLMTFPLAAGDEVLIHFSSRCIDGWWQAGQVSPQAQFRMHDLSDGFVSPKVYSVPKVPGGVSTTAAQLRTMDGTAHIEMAPGGIINMLAPGGMNVTGNLGVTGNVSFGGGSGDEAVITGNIQLNGSLSATGQITASGKALSTHTHSGVTTGGSNTGPPV
jgi:hypothetical protein